MADEDISSPELASKSTARSRVLAMLAKLDNESQNPDIHTLDSNSPDPSSNLSNSNVEFDRPSLSMSSSDVEDEDDDIVIKPRGRIAARLAVHDEETGTQAQTESARDRVEEALLNSTKKSPAPAYDAGTGDADGNQEQDMDASLDTREHISRHGTPEPTMEAEKPIANSMFVSPASNRSASPARDGSDSDADLPAIPAQDSRLMELVAKKRAERLAREAERKALRESQAVENEDHERSDEDIERSLTQQARPTRKASKKAIEEMHRETQRMSRNMQLAHQAKTKKKITKSSLFAKFNYKPTGVPEDEAEERSRPATSSSAPQSEADKHETPPTSPMSHAGDVEKQLEPQPENQDNAEEEDLPEIADVLRLGAHIPSSPPVVASKVDKGKGKAVEVVERNTKSPVQRPKTIFTQRPIRVRPPKVPITTMNIGNDSDSDLEIVPDAATDLKKLSVFDRVPIKQAKESHSLQALRMLAHITSPGKKESARNKKPSITASELGLSLQQRARQQAAREREEREQALREKGVIIQTAEEREKELADVEDILAKARREADELAKHEKIAAKKEQKENGGTDQAEVSSDDEEWEEEKENLAEELSGSGSEDEGVDADVSNADSEEEEDIEDEVMVLDEETVDQSTAGSRHALIDNEASESDAEEEHDAVPDEDDAAFIDDGELVDEDGAEDVAELPVTKSRRKHLNVISDDEDDDAEENQGTVQLHTDSPQPRQTESPMAPPSVLRSATKTFIPGLTVAGPAGLGLTQIFAGTMDDSQTQAPDMSPSQFARGANSNDGEEDSLAFLRNLPAPDLPEFKPTMEEDSQDVVRDSQSGHTQARESQLQNSVSQRVQLDFSQSQIHGFDSLPHDPSETQFSDLTQLTQDAGFQIMSPIMGRFAEPPPSTVDTVVLETTPKPGIAEESPIVKRKGKLRRRTEIQEFSDEEELGAEADIGDEDFEISANVFDVMRKAAKEKKTVVDEFDKKKSGAKEMVEEQAEESEDEYAGLGGASDDDSEGEEDALVRAMIDDEAGKDIDESKLAAFYADKERANDEKQVEKLYKDITSGMLRRKRGADFDLSDSDDGGEARRRMKRREFAKMRQALFADERIEKIAENPKKLAFLRAIEDRGDDDEEMDFLEDFAESNEGSDSQSQSQAEDSQKEATHIPDSQPQVVMGPPKRKIPSNTEAAKRPPPYLRRTQPDKRPSNLSEIRQSLSSLIEEPNAIIAASHDSSDSEPDNDDGDEVSDLKGKGKEKEKENRDPFARRNNIPTVDRISLKRANSNNLSSNAKLAFTANSATVGGFKVPPLLRRATTNSSISSSSSSVSTSAGGRSNESKGFVKRGATKNSGVHYFARERERIEKVAEGEKRREEKRLKHAAGRRTVVGGLFGMGKFE